jgi:Peptidase M60, enhancin and enhancin-like
MTPESRSEWSALLSVVLLFAAAPRVPTQQGAVVVGSSDRAPSMEGVREVAAPESPGSIAVFSKEATPLATGTSGGDGDVPVIASATLGRGRVVVFAHDGYFGDEAFKIADTAPLLTSAMRWVAHDTPKPRIGLIDGHQLRSLFEPLGATVVPTKVDQSFRALDALVLTPYDLTAEQVQLYEAFGSKPFAHVFAEYARLPDAERPKSDDEKRNQWLVRMSKATGKNLGPFFVRWGVPTSEKARASIASLPPWMPQGFEPGH